ncbi:hypothetical protein RFI_17354, partial [Reticulomyxa filosa]
DIELHLGGNVPDDTLSKIMASLLHHQRSENGSMEDMDRYTDMDTDIDLKTPRKTERVNHVLESLSLHVDIPYSLNRVSIDPGDKDTLYSSTFARIIELIDECSILNSIELRITKVFDPAILKQLVESICKNPMITRVQLKHVDMCEEHIETLTKLFDINYRGLLTSKTSHSSSSPHELNPSNNAVVKYYPFVPFMDLFSVLFGEYRRVGPSPKDEMEECKEKFRHMIDTILEMIPAYQQYHQCVLQILVNDFFMPKDCGIVIFDYLFGDLGHTFNGWMFGSFGNRRFTTGEGKQCGPLIPVLLESPLDPLSHLDNQNSSEKNTQPSFIPKMMTFNDYFKYKHELLREKYPCDIELDFDIS